MLKRLFGLAVLLTAVVSCRGMSVSEPLDEWIGQMLMVGFRGTELSAESPFARQLVRLHLGGVILSDYDVSAKTGPRNIQSPTQLRKLVEALQAATAGTLLIALDQEGGKVARLKPGAGFSESRSAFDLGAEDSEEATRREASATARLLRQLGINLNLAPVVDVNLNLQNPIIGLYGRSFSADPLAVTRHARYVIEEHRRAGVLTSLKHFPGHGSSLEDSHRGMPDVTDVWKPVELEPYRTLIAEGNADLVMTAHLFNRRLDAEFPASLSKATTTGLLRRELGFAGVVITDDLGMNALAERYPLRERVRLAIEAGADILLMANNWGKYDPELAPKAVTAIKALVEEGTVSPDRLRRSFDRIQDLKKRLP